MKILSISAAPGWVGTFKQDDGTIEEYPLACWAVGQDAHVKGETDVVGLLVDPDTNLLERCDGSENFVTYRHESEKTSPTQTANR